MAQLFFGIQFFSVVLLLFLAVYIFSRWRTKLQGYLFFHEVVVLVNNAGYLLCMTAKTEGEYLIGLKSYYLGKVWVPFSLLLLVIALCKRKVSQKFLCGLAFLQILTYIMVLFVEKHPLYYTDIQFSNDGMLPCISHGNGIWYNFYTAMILSYIVYGMYHLIRMSIIEKGKIAKKRYICVAIGVLCNSIFYILRVCKVVESYDLTMIGYTINNVCMCIAIFKYNLIDTLQIAKDYCVEELAEGIIVANKAGEVEYCNRPAKTVFPELEENAPITLRELEEHIERNESFDRNGRIYLPQVKEFQNATQEGAKVYVLLDNTEQVKHMDELTKQKEIAEEANASKSAFLSVVSHEIRTPMNVIVGMTDLLLQEEETLSPKQVKYLKNIKNSGSALVMIVNDILDQSKIEAGKMEIVEDVYELRPLVNDVKLIIENRIGSKLVKLITEVDEQIPDVMVGDSLRIRQILINLMNNAVKFTSEGFIKLAISVVKMQDDNLLLCFTVEDSGQGIKESDLSKLGQAFTQVDTKRNHSMEGTGLGLSISRDFIALMGGELAVRSVYGKGTVFSFEISQGRVPESGAVKGKAENAWKEDISFTAQTAQILVVDDTAVNLMIVKEMLAPLHMTVDTADSGKKAIELVRTNRYDLIFMDYMMPHMDGVEATEKIRKLSEEAEESGNEAEAVFYKTVPIIAFTGDCSEETKDLFFRAGIDDMIEKPVDLKRLKKLILTWLPADKVSLKE